MENTADIAQIIEDLYPTGLAAELAKAKGETLTPAEALEALEALYASDPHAATAVRETFLAWPPERQSKAIDALSGAGGSKRRAWSRLLFGIAEGPDGAPTLA